MASDSKSAAAFRTIGEVAQATGLAPHILRYWESRFPQLKPVTRAGNRRYYRPQDIALVERIDRLLHRDGYTIKGVQQLLAREVKAPAARPEPTTREVERSTSVAGLIAIRDLLSGALSDD